MTARTYLFRPRRPPTPPTTPHRPQHENRMTSLSRIYLAIFRWLSLRHGWTMEGEASKDDLKIYEGDEIELETYR